MLEIFQQFLKCKWTLMILDRFANGTVRPGELRRSIKGLSSKVMYERIKMLEDNAIIRHELVSDKPLEVHYCLTETGRRLCDIISQIRHLD